MTGVTGVGVVVVVGAGVVVAVAFTVTATVAHPPLVPQTVMLVEPLVTPVIVSTLPLITACTATGFVLAETKYVVAPEAVTVVFWPTASDVLTVLSVTLVVFDEPLVELVPEPTVTGRAAQTLSREQIVSTVDPLATPVMVMALPFSTWRVTPKLELLET